MPPTSGSFKTVHRNPGRRPTYRCEPAPNKKGGTHIARKIDTENRHLFVFKTPQRTGITYACAREGEGTCEIATRLGSTPIWARESLSWSKQLDRSTDHRHTHLAVDILLPPIECYGQSHVGASYCGLQVIFRSRRLEHFRAAPALAGSRF